MDDTAAGKAGKAEWPVVRLSGRELLVLQLASQGYTRAQINELLYGSACQTDGTHAETADELLVRAMRTLGARSVREAVSEAIKLRLIG
jgi:hypothetical protein